MMRPSLAEVFPDVFRAGDVGQATVRGGRSAALAALQALDPETYARDRNHLDGHVSRLSAYLRHGVLTPAEVRDHALAVAGQRAWKYVDELSWCDYHQRVYAVVGRRIWTDLRPYGTGHPASSYVADLPDDVAAGTTGLACVDAWSEELRRTGYLHNHVRMWFASYLVHHRRVRWQAGARFFLRHLLDGDPASNNLSWQWVAATNRSRPYLFNRENLQRYAGDRWCASCPLRETGCPFAASYDELGARLLAGDEPAPGETGTLAPGELRRVRAQPSEQPPVDGRVVVWVHGDRLSPTHEGLVAHPDAPAVFVWDTDLVARAGTSGSRLRFVDECLAELPCGVRVGAGPSGVADQVAAHATDQGARTVVTTTSPSPRFARLCREIEAAGLTVRRLAPPPFVEPPGPVDLRNHTAYWRQVQHQALRPT